MLAGNKPMGYLGFGLQRAIKLIGDEANSRNLSPNMEKGIPNAAVKCLDPTAPEARPLRFKPAAIRLSLCNKPWPDDYSRRSVPTCKAGLDQEGGEGEERKTLEKRQGSRGMVRQERENCAGRDIVKRRVPWIMTFLAWSLRHSWWGLSLPPPLLPIPSHLFFWTVHVPLSANVSMSPVLKHPWAQEVSWVGARAVLS